MSKVFYKTLVCIIVCFSIFCTFYGGAFTFISIYFSDIKASDQIDISIKRPPSLRISRSADDRYVFVLMTDEGYNKQLLNVLFGLYAAHRLNATFVIPAFVFSDHNIEDQKAVDGKTLTWENFFDFESYSREAYGKSMKYAFFTGSLYDKYGGTAMDCHLFNDKIFYSQNARKDVTQFHVRYPSGNSTDRWVWNWKLKRSVNLSRLREENIVIVDHLDKSGAVYVNQMPWDHFQKHPWNCFVGEKMGQILPERLLSYHIPIRHQKLRDKRTLGVHIRRGDRMRACDGSGIFVKKNQDPDFIATCDKTPMRTIEEIESKRADSGISQVLITTDETDPDWIQAFKEKGYLLVDHGEYELPNMDSFLIEMQVLLDVDVLLLFGKSSIHRTLAITRKNLDKVSWIYFCFTIPSCPQKVWPGMSDHVEILG